jgi:hypothetical protein
MIYEEVQTREGADTRERSCPAGQHRVLRGASWNNNERVNLRSAYRNNEDPRNRNDNNGFRVVLVVAGGKAPSGQKIGEMLPRARSPWQPEPRGSLNWAASPWGKRVHGGHAAGAVCGAGDPRG